MLGTQSPGNRDKRGRVNATGQRRRVRCGTWPSRRVGRCRCDAQQQQQQQHLRCGSAPLAASRPSSRPRERERSPSSYHLLLARHLHAARRLLLPRDDPSHPFSRPAPLSRRSASRKLNRREHAAARRPTALRVPAFSFASRRCA